MLTIAGRTVAAAALAVTHIAPLDGFTSGDESATTGSRQSISFSQSGGTLTSSGAANWTTTGTTAVKAYGGFTAVTGGEMRFVVPNHSGTAKIRAAGVKASTAAMQSPDHGYANTNRVVVFGSAEGLPTQLTEGGEYYIVSAATDTFQLSATSGGTAITPSSDGSIVLSDFEEDSIASAATLTLNAGAQVFV